MAREHIVALLALCCVLAPAPAERWVRGEFVANETIPEPEAPTIRSSLQEIESVDYPLGVFSGNIQLLT